MKSFIVTVAATACSITLFGCNATHPRESPQALFASMEKSMSKLSDANVTKTNLTDIDMASYPLLQEVCNTSFSSPNYEYAGDKMRAKILKYSYKLPVASNGDSMIYRHEYAVCFGFYAPGEDQVQEAVYVKYLSTLKASFGDMLPAIRAVTGGSIGLMLDSGMNLNATVENNTWAQVPSKVYSEETSRVQYLKMNPVDMKAVNKYDAEKFSDVIAFEYVHANVTKVGDKVVFASVDTAVIEDVLH